MFIQNYVFRFQISIDNIKRFMKISQSQNDLNREEFDLILVKPFDLLQVLKQFTPIYVVHYEINAIAFLK